LDSYGASGLLQSRILNISLFWKQLWVGKGERGQDPHFRVAASEQCVALMYDMSFFSKSIKNIKILLLSVLSLKLPLMILPDLARTHTKSTV
jgi:hypothetical protein